MEQLIEIMKQIRELAGVAVDALEGAASDAGGEQGPPEGEQPPPGGAPGEQPPA